MYVDPNFKTKKALKEAVAAGKAVSVFQPTIPMEIKDGRQVVEGPHYPQAHTWYATVEVKDSMVTKVVA